MSVKEYIRKFEQLKIRSGIEEEPEHTVVRFLRGLDQCLAEKVDIQPYRSFEDVCKLAIKVERYSKNKKPFTNAYSHCNPPLEPYTPLKPYSTPKPETHTKPDC